MDHDQGVDVTIIIIIINDNWFSSSNLCVKTTDDVDVVER